MLRTVAANKVRNYYVSNGHGRRLIPEYLDDSQF